MILPVGLPPRLPNAIVILLIGLVVIALASEQPQRRHLWLVKKRYLADPQGHRKHPSYYSESYLQRGRAITDAERTDLKSQWGSWTLKDDKRASRPGDDFYAKYTNRDVPFADFPAHAWQRDMEYLAKFLDQATDLTKRAMEAILAEYGKPPANPSNPEADFELRSAAFHVKLADLPSEDKRNLDDKTQKEKGGWIAKKSWEGLKRRLLHSIMTEDSFNLVMGGHSAAAGHGNHFEQSYTLQYGRIMEPIFARLGVKGTASNMGMGGLGTMHNSMGAGSIYGREVDILVWDSGMTEKALDAQGIFATQGILGSNRAPFLWYDRKSCLIEMHNEMDADVGVFGSGMSVLTEADSFDALSAQMWATRYMKCSNEINMECKKNRYNGTCWIDRPNFSWEGIQMEEFVPKQKLKAQPGGRASWHPGNRVHQLQGRVLAFTILHALHEALTEWKQADNYQLPDEAWHVTEKYQNIHTKVAASPTTNAWCKGKDIPLAFCRVVITARTEYSPRSRPWETSIRSIIKASGNVPTVGPNLYDPPDVYNPLLDPPIGEIDVLSIVENGVDFAPNLARIRDSSENMTFQEPVYESPVNPATVPGKGWALAAVGTDNCDGFYDSFCKRGGDNDCLLYAHNNDRGNIVFDGLSGWMIFNIPKIEHGLITLGLYDWVSGNSATDGWCSENNEEVCTSRNLREGAPRQAASTTSPEGSPLGQESRYLKKKSKSPAYCPDFKFEYAINGHITSLDLETWNSMMKHIQRVVQIWTIMDDPSFTGENVELAMRMTGCGRSKVFGLTHIYWA